MLKSICKNVVWMALPLSLALGCAANRSTTTEAQYGPVPVLTPTSGEPEQRIYSTAPGTAATSSDMDAPPPGATTANWNVAEAIRQKLTEDPTLAPLGSKVITEVGKDGTVTLKGTVKTPEEQKRVHDTIASVPGVNSLNDELKVGTYRGGGRLDINQE
jgi:hypothetical protein